MKKPSADFSRRIFLEGWVLPNRLKNFRHGRAVPSELLPNEFGAQEKIRHQPLVEASVMGGFRILSSNVGKVIGMRYHEKREKWLRGLREREKNGV